MTDLEIVTKLKISQKQIIMQVKLIKDFGNRGSKIPGVVITVDIPFANRKVKCE
jgi:hypothetical protein